MIERSNEEWLEDLREPRSEQAISDLRDILLRGLRAALYSKIRRNLDFVMEDFVQEALIKILDNLETFRGESRFTTWAHKIAINVAFTELRRRRWENVSLQEIADRYEGNDFTPVILTDPSLSPEQKALLQILMETINHLIEHDLTEKQSTAMKAVVFGGMPIDVVARRMGSNRNALYKLMHDARKRLKEHMLAADLTPEEVLAIFDES